MLKYINKKIFFALMMFFMLFSIGPQITTTYALTTDNVTVGNDYTVKFETDKDLDEKGLIERYSKLLTTFSMLCTLTLMGFLILNITKLAGSAGNPYQRQSAVTALIWNFVAIALFGSITFWFMFSFSLFKK